jgi:hypothetical protein
MARNRGAQRDAPDVIEKINEAGTAALADPQIRARVRTLAARQCR